jgi:curved DNA-binding protein
MSQSDYYKIMGVDKSVSADELKKVYRKLARKYHPDVSRAHNAEHKFKELNEAYETLKDTNKRAQYDLGQQTGGFGGRSRRAGQQRYGQSDWHSDSKPADFFDNLFGNRAAKPKTKPGEDFHVPLNLSLSDALRGGKQKITVHVPEINKHGDKQLISHSLSVNIPDGVRTGTKIRLKGQGATASFNGPKGDLFLEIKLVTSKPYRLEGDDVYVDLPLAPWEAALGCVIEVPTLAGKVGLTIKAGTQGGCKMRLKGRGLPASGEKIKATDAYVEINIVLPLDDSKKTQNFYQKMAKTFDFNPREGWS